MSVRCFILYISFHYANSWTISRPNTLILDGLNHLDRAFRSFNSNTTCLFFFLSRQSDTHTLRTPFICIPQKFALIKIVSVPNYIIWRSRVKYSRVLFSYGLSSSSGNQPQSFRTFEIRFNQLGKYLTEEKRQIEWERRWVRVVVPVVFAINALQPWHERVPSCGQVMKFVYLWKFRRVRWSKGYNSSSEKCRLEVFWCR